MAGLETFGLEMVKKEKNQRAIEVDFPIYFVSQIAKAESWRKEIYRPPYYIHKWWARRLGSVFREIIISALSDCKSNAEELFSKPIEFENKIIYDPFMGSGVTVGEAIKLGCRVIGRDINPVSSFMVKTYLNDYNLDRVNEEYKSIEKAVSKQIKGYYKAKYKDELVDVLYYFWVKLVECPECRKNIDLFTSRIFARHASPKKHPEVKTICPKCGEVNVAEITDEEIRCRYCSTKYNIHKGNANKGKVICPFCGHAFGLIDEVKSRDSPLEHRLFAKLVLTKDNKKLYLKADKYDLELYKKASSELQKEKLLYPTTKVIPGYNTNQAINYGYKYWFQFFNDRQLLTLSILANRIKKMKDESLRHLFGCLFSGVLEFNNMFCSYKGEGTGAIRPLFSHHILKPEMMSMEANVWGTNKSSGSFKTLFQTRIKRALEYKENPFEIIVEGKKTKKIFDISKKLNTSVSVSFEDFKKCCSTAYISCGSSDSTDIEDKTVDVVVTDPPFFDNVNYSELADFFYSWIRLIFDEEKCHEKETTRSGKEVQDTSHTLFSEKLGNVFKDANRVLKDEGLLIFTYHQSKDNGWSSLVKALHYAGFCIVATYPVRSEMSVALPKQLSKEPINYDIIFVALKRQNCKILKDVPKSLEKDAMSRMKRIVNNYRKNGYNLSKNDIKVILMAEILKMSSKVDDVNIIENYLFGINGNINRIVEDIYQEQRLH